VKHSHRVTGGHFFLAIKNCSYFSFDFAGFIDSHKSPPYPKKLHFFTSIVSPQSTQLQASHLIETRPEFALTSSALAKERERIYNNDLKIDDRD
jgi:hypothetical protein